MEEQAQQESIEVLEREVITSFAGIVRRSALFALVVATLAVLAVAIGARLAF